MPLLPVPTKQKETQRPARRESGEGWEWEVTKNVLKMREIIRVSAWFCPERKDPRQRVDLSRSRGLTQAPSTRGWEAGGKVKIESLSLFVSKTVCRQVRACSTQRNTQTRTHTHARRLIYGCGYFTTSATHIPFGGANEKHWKVGFPLSIFLYRGRKRYNSERRKSTRLHLSLVNARVFACYYEWFCFSC